MTTYNITTASNFAAACKVFAEVESKAQGWAERLAALGITGVDVQPYVTAYVSKVTGVKAHPSQRGDSLVFKKDSPEYNRVKYICRVIRGPIDMGRHTKSEHTDPVAKLLASYNKLDASQKRAFKKAIA